MKKIINIVSIIILVLIVYNYCKDFNNSFKIKKEIVIEEKNNIDQELNSYILGVLACEMPALYDEEALKAQAIAIRTFALLEKDYKKSTGQCYINEEEMKSKWNNSFDKYYTKLKDIVLDTNNLVVLQDNKLLKTFYFSTSNGYTLDSKDVFNNYNLKGVDSSFDKTSKDYEKTIYLTKAELEKILGSFNNIDIRKRDKTNHVLEIYVDNKKYTGIEFRKKLNLRSTDFIISKDNDNYKITTYGYGHGVGMSQYGANYLAKEGYNYENILKYYYGNIEIKNYV